MDEHDFDMPTDESLISALLALSATPRRTRRQYFRDEELFAQLYAERVAMRVT